MKFLKRLGKALLPVSLILIIVALGVVNNYFGAKGVQTVLFVMVCAFIIGVVACGLKGDD
jgi:lipopolysaccharide export LptBFGC system permease protein LptF